MEFRASNAASSETNHSDSFQFAPAARAVLLAKPRQLANRGAYGNCFNVGDIRDDLKEFTRCLQE